MTFNGEVIDGAHEAMCTPRTVGPRSGAARGRYADPEGRPRQTSPPVATCSRGGCCAVHTAALPCSSEACPAEGREDYRCAGRSDYGIDHCPQTPIPRAKIDTAALDYFREVGLDVDAMRAELDAAVKGRRELVAARLHEAEGGRNRRLPTGSRGSGATTKTASLDAADWRSLLLPNWFAELEAARAELRQAQERDAELVEAEANADDPEAEALARLESIRQSVAGKIEDAEGINAVRAALVDMFDAFYVRVLAAADPLDPADALPGELDAAERVRAQAREALRRAGSAAVRGRRLAALRPHAASQSWSAALTTPFSRSCAGVV